MATSSRNKPYKSSEQRYTVQFAQLIISQLLHEYMGEESAFM